MAAEQNDANQQRVSDKQEATREQVSSAINPELWQCPDNPRLTMYMRQFDDLYDRGLLDLDSFISSVKDTDNLEGQTVDAILAFNKEDKLRAVKAIAFNRLLTKKNKCYVEEDDMINGEPTGQYRSCLEIAESYNNGKGANLIGFKDGYILFSEIEMAKETYKMTCPEADKLVKMTGSCMFPHNINDNQGEIYLLEDSTTLLPAKVQIVREFVQEVLSLLTLTELNDMSSEIDAILEDAKKSGSNIKNNQGKIYLPTYRPKQPAKAQIVKTLLERIDLFSPEQQAFMKATGEPITPCIGEEECHGTWVFFEEDEVDEQGNKTGKKSISGRRIYFHPDGCVIVSSVPNIIPLSGVGIRRLLRV